MPLELQLIRLSAVPAWVPLVLCAAPLLLAADRRGRPVATLLPPAVAVIAWAAWGGSAPRWGLVGLSLDGPGALMWMAAAMGLWAARLDARRAAGLCAAIGLATMAAGPVTALIAAGALLLTQGRRRLLTGAALVLVVAVGAASLWPARLWLQGAALGTCCAALVLALAARPDRLGLVLVAGAWGAVRIAPAFPDAWRVAAPGLAWAAVGLAGVAAACVFARRPRWATGALTLAGVLLALRGGAAGFEAATLMTCGGALSLAGQALFSGRARAFFAAAGLGLPGAAAGTGLLIGAQVAAFAPHRPGLLPAALTLGLALVALATSLLRAAPEGGGGRAAWPLAVGLLVLGVGPLVARPLASDAGSAARRLERPDLPAGDVRGWRTLSRRTGPRAQSPDAGP